MSADLKISGSRKTKSFDYQEDGSKTSLTILPRLRPNLQDERGSCSPTITKLASSDSCTFKASPDEVAAALLLGVFTMATPMLGKYVTQRMKRRFGEGKWFNEILKGLGRSRLRPRLKKQPNVLRHDIHLVTKIFLNELETIVDISGSCAVHIDEVGVGGVLLQSIAVEVDCIGETRNALHHGLSLSASEVLRCLQSLERLWHRMEPEELPRQAMDDLRQNIQVTVR